MNQSKILYVDDEPTNLLLFQMNLKKKYHIITSENPLKALDILAVQPDIKIIISDMKMPDMNGLQFITKAIKLYPERKFYILTGFDINEEIDKALKSGLICKYFQKPFNIPEISAELDEMLKTLAADI